MEEEVLNYATDYMLNGTLPKKMGSGVLARMSVEGFYRDFVLWWLGAGDLPQRPSEPYFPKEITIRIDTTS